MAKQAATAPVAKTATIQLSLERCTPGTAYYMAAKVEKGETRPLVTAQYLTKDGLEALGVDTSDEANMPQNIAITVAIS